VESLNFLLGKVFSDRKSRTPAITKAANRSSPKDEAATRNSNAGADVQSLPSEKQQPINCKEKTVMAKVILFGGGDGGGIHITPKGIKPIPPFDPALRYQLRALNSLARAGRLMPEKESARLLGGVITKLSGAVLTQIEILVGEIDADNGLIYQDEDGGFTCGSTGQPPIPFPWPVDPRKTVDDLVSRGVLNATAIAFLQQAAKRKLDVFTVARDPQAAAKKIGVSLTPEVEQSLLAFSPERAKTEDPVDREVIEFYQKVIQDGRFIANWVVNPAAVAERLKMKVSQRALDRIVATRDFGITQPGGAVMSPAAVAVAVAIVIVLWSSEVDLPVIDRSGAVKL
jgi:hypothetical protein